MQHGVRHSESDVLVVGFRTQVLEGQHGNGTRPDRHHIDTCFWLLSSFCMILRTPNATEYQSDGYDDCPNAPSGEAIIAAAMAPQKIEPAGSEMFCNAPIVGSGDFIPSVDAIPRSTVGISR